MPRISKRRELIASKQKHVILALLGEFLCMTMQCQVPGLEYCTSFANCEYNGVAGLGHGASNELHSYQEEYSRCAMRGYSRCAVRGFI